MSGQLTGYGAALALEEALVHVGTPYLGLVTALPSNPNTASLADFASLELTVGGYSRQEVQWYLLEQDGLVTAANQNTIDFGPFSDDPPEVTGCFLTDAASGTTGHVYAWWGIAPGKDATINDLLRFAQGGLSMMINAAPVW